MDFSDGPTFMGVPTILIFMLYMLWKQNQTRNEPRNGADTAGAAPASSRWASRRFALPAKSVEEVVEFLDGSYGVVAGNLIEYKPSKSVALAFRGGEVRFESGSHGKVTMSASSEYESDFILDVFELDWSDFKPSKKPLNLSDPYYWRK